MFNWASYNSKGPRGCNYGPLRLGSGEIDPEETVASVHSRFQTALKEPKVRSTWDVSMSKFVWRTKKVLNSNMKVRNLYLRACRRADFL